MGQNKGAIFKNKKRNSHDCMLWHPGKKKETPARKESDDITMTVQKCPESFQQKPIMLVARSVVFTYN